MKILELSQVLRKKGIPVSIRSTKLAYSVYEIFKGSSHLKDALASVYVKDKKQLEVFEEAFNEVFHGKEKDEIEERKLKTRQDSGIVVEEPEGMVLVEEEIDFQPPIVDLPHLDRDERSLLEMDVSKLDFFDTRIFELCKKLGLKIANRRSRRFKGSRVGRPDIRKSIRKNLKYGGALIELINKKPSIKKSQHIFLCDVSGSCDWISNWFFCIVYAAQHTFYNSRFFDFDNKIVETTKALQEDDLLTAFQNLRVSRQQNMMLHGTSNMYTAFKEFKENVVFPPRSYIIILSDCRDWAGPREGGIPLSARVLEEICQRCRKVLILNPEDKSKWDVVDSCVSYYMDAGASVKEVRNLRQLAQTIEKI
ncbi:MAG: VWA domain-containing protein [Methanothermobacter sp.]